MTSDLCTSDSCHGSNPISLLYFLYKLEQILSVKTLGKPVNLACQSRYSGVNTLSDLVKAGKYMTNNVQNFNVLNSELTIFSLFVYICFTRISQAFNIKLLHLIEQLNDLHWIFPSFRS